MIKQIGKVIEVFIPTEENKDVMNSNKIGFKIQLDEEEITIIEEQNEYNSRILKDDKVTIIKQNIKGKKYIDIELYDGEENE